MWVSRFYFSPPSTGILSQEGAFSQSEKVKPPIAPSALWVSYAKRFRERAARAGFKNAAPSLDEAISQGASGCHIDPLLMAPVGAVDGFSPGGANIAFRFGVPQNAKLRGRDDLKQNMVNLRTSVVTPITLPNWGHISQMAKRVPHNKARWASMKADRRSAYTKLLLCQNRVNLTLVALRNPISGRWFAFVPKVLLFGEVSAVLHYNCFALILTVLANKILGSPILNYFGDFGPLVPELIDRLEPETFLRCATTIGALTKDDKSDVETSLTFSGLWGDPLVLGAK